MESRQGIDRNIGRSFDESIGRARFSRVIAKFGAAGLAFFLLKGLAWVLVPAAIAYWSGR